VKFEIHEAIQALARTPGVLREMLAGLNDEWVYGNYGEGTFSPFDVVGHLIHGERTDWIPRAKIILEHGAERPFEPFDRYAMYEASEGKTIGELLDTFDALRRENIEKLRALNLTDDDLARPGMHPELGPVTMEALLAAWVVHDLNHIAQIAKALAFQYRDAVGAWQPYMSILQR
jgi:hypothetical protein